MSEQFRMTDLNIQQCVLGLLLSRKCEFQDDWTSKQSQSYPIFFDRMVWLVENLKNSLQ